MKLNGHARAAVSAAAILAAGFYFLSSPAGTETEQGRIDRINREIREKGQHWTAGTTSVSRLSLEEKRALCGYVPPPVSENSSIPVIKAPEGATYDSQFDWRTQGGTTPAKDQGGCGSCWVFAAVGQLESHVKIYEGREEDLSEQQIMDCNLDGRGCNGGWASTAYSVMMDYGSVREACYPYLSGDGYPCTETDCEAIGRIATYYSVPNNVDDIKEALLSGPVWTTIDVVDRFYDYFYGCFGGDDEVVGYHAILIVGWDDAQCGGEGAWIIKNSWGLGWGQDGFGYVEYGSNRIGTASSQIIYEPTDVYVDLLDPNGGEVLQAGQDYEIQWTTSRTVADSISILLSIDGGDSYEYTIASIPFGTLTSYMWNVGYFPVTEARIKVVAWYGGGIGGYDFSESDFTIQAKPYRYVSPTGGNIYPYSTPLWAAHTIGDAVDAAVDGDSIMVETGTYNERVSVTKQAYLMGGWNAGFTMRDPDVYPTTINSNGSAVSFLYMTSGSPGIEGFTITGGTGTSTLMPTNGIYGGGVFVYSSPAIIRGNIFTSNGYTSSSGFSGGGGIACYDGTVTIEGNEISGCIAQSGGGIYLYHATATITGNTMSGSSPNVAFTGERSGGGIYALSSEVTMSGNVISGNSGYRYGGGLYADLTPVATSGDSIYGNDDAVQGGGVYAEHSALSMSHGYVQGNTASSAGGGIYHKAAQLDISNTIVAENSAGQFGGGVYADSVWGDWTNNTFDRNSASIVVGNVFLSAAAPADVRDNIISYGYPSGFHAGVDVNITYQYNNAFGNNGDDVVTLVPDATNISRDPAYADTTALDYHLALHSGSVDGGDPAGSDPDGSVADQGAFGGPAALFPGPDLVQNLAAAATSDTTITISWDGRTPEGLDFYAIYSDTAPGFTPDALNFIGTSDAATSVFQHHPVEGCHYYRVSYIDGAGYMSGFSNEDNDCASGADTENPFVMVVQPDGGAMCVAGHTFDIQWIATDNAGVDSVSIYYSANNGGDYTLLASGEPNDSTYIWTIPIEIPGSDSCLVLVRAYDPSLNVGDGLSADLFTIHAHVTDVEETPLATALHQNFPNPFNGHTTISYTIEKPVHVSVKIYDTAGRLVRTLVDGDRVSGNHDISWNGRDNALRPVASGIYFMRMTAGEYGKSKKIVYLR